MHLHAALITSLTVLLMFVTGILVGRARGKYQITAPATSGHPDFDRVFRAQMNTLEQAVIFLPVLWLASLYANEAYATYFGFAWLLGRILYVAGYIKEAGKRGMGFMVSLLAFAGLFSMSLWAIAAQLFG